MDECIYTHTFSGTPQNGFLESICCLVTCWALVCLRVCSPTCPLTQRKLSKQLPEAGEGSTQGRTALHVKCCDGSELRILQKALCYFQHPGQRFKETQSKGTGSWYCKVLISCLTKTTLARELRLSLFPTYSFASSACSILLQKYSSKATYIYFFNYNISLTIAVSFVP